jgi:trigger factor
MSNVTRTDIDALNAVLTVSIPKEMYLTKVKKEITKYSQKSSMKGFRPGKTPPTLVRKMHGREFLMDVVNETIQKELNEYLTENKPVIMGQPIMAKEQADFKLDLNNPQDVVFKFDIGLAPTFDLKGLDDAQYDRYVIAIDESTIEKEIEGTRKRLGKESEVTGKVQEGDLLTLDIKEIGGSLEKELMLSIDWVTEDMKSVFFTQSQGDSLEINIFQLENDTTSEYVRKYFLGLEEHDTRIVNETFNATIKTIKRKVDAELNEENLEAAFGPGVTTVEAAKDTIRKTISGNFDSQSDALLLRDLQEGLIAANQFAMPDEFLKRWLKLQNEKIADDVVEKEYSMFADSLRWSMIRSKIVETSNIKIDENDVREHYANKIRGYFGGMPVDETMVQSLVDRVYDNEKQWDELYEDVMTERVFDAMKSRTTLNDKSVSNAEFQEIMIKARAEATLRKEGAKELMAEVTESAE